MPTIKIEDLNKINIILGKVGSGKSNLMRDFFEENRPVCSYIAPERSGFFLSEFSDIQINFEQDPIDGIDVRINRSPGFKSHCQHVLYKILKSKKEDPNELAYYTKLMQDKLNEILPNIRLEIANILEINDRLLRIYRRTGNGLCSISHISSGEGELISLAISIFDFFLSEKNFLLMDEPDAHLHPDSQYKIMNLIKYFLLEKEKHVIIATHSTAIVSAASDLFKEEASICFLKNPPIVRRYAYEMIYEKKESSPERENRGFYFYRNNDKKIYVLVVHSKKNSEIKCLTEIAGSDLLNELKWEENTQKDKENISEDLVNLIIKNCNKIPVEFIKIEEQYKSILPIFGAHSLTQVFNSKPILLVEGMDDKWIWDILVRKEKANFYPCETRSVGNMVKYISKINKIAHSVYDNPSAFAVRDKDRREHERKKFDKKVNEIENNVVSVFTLKCYAIENLCFTDEFLELWGGLKWEDLSSPKYDEYFTTRDKQFFQREDRGISKNCKGELAALMRFLYDREKEKEMETENQIEMKKQMGMEKLQPYTAKISPWQEAVATAIIRAIDKINEKGFDEHMTKNHTIANYLGKDILEKLFGLDCKLTINANNEKKTNTDNKSEDNLRNFSSNPNTSWGKTKRHKRDRENSENDPRSGF